MKSIEKGKQGHYRRVLGIISLLSIIIYGFIGLIFDKHLDSVFITMITATGGTLLGIGNITDIWKNKNNSSISNEQNNNNYNTSTTTATNAPVNNINIKNKR